jgi:hypothetical protein
MVNSSLTVQSLSVIVAGYYYACADHSYEFGLVDRS